MPRKARNGAAQAAPAAAAVPSPAAHEAAEGAQEPAAVAEPAVLEQPPVQADAPLEPPAAEQPPEPPAPKPYDYSTLSAAQRENPECLQGEDLRRLAYQRGISRSEAGRCSDQKLRQQLRLIAYRQYERD